MYHLVTVQSISDGPTDDSVMPRADPTSGSTIGYILNMILYHLSGQP